MPAMRFFTSIFPILAALVAAPAFSQDKPADAVKPESVKESVPGPLAPGEERLDSLYGRLKKERGSEQGRQGEQSHGHSVQKSPSIVGGQAAPARPE